MILADYHMHTSFSSDSEAEPHAQADAAVRAGLKHICITDHYDYGFPGGDFMINEKVYCPAIAALREEYRDRIEIRTGIEIGLRPDACAPAIKQMAACFPWDFIIGSTHVVDGDDPYFPVSWEGKDTDAYMRRYYEITKENIKEYDFFQVYGHIDYIARYIPKERNFSYNILDYMDMIDEILKALIQKGKGIECNTAGFKKALGRPNPEALVLKRYRELGGEILTIGSDGHAPEYVAYGFDKIPEILSECGFSYYTIFRDQKPVMLPL